MFIPNIAINGWYKSSKMGGLWHWVHHIKVTFAEFGEHVPEFGEHDGNVTLINI